MKNVIQKCCCFLLICSLVIICSGCHKLPDSYYTPSENFKGMNFECYSDGNNANNVRNQMVYMDFCDIVKEDLNQKGNKITSVSVNKATGEVFHETHTVANLEVQIEAESGEVTSGKYHILAYFTYNAEDETNVKMYLMNYCFHSSSKVDKSLFEPYYEKIKDKKIP